MRALTWQGNRERRGHRRPRPADRGADRRDHPGHLDRDLRLGPAPVRRARPVPQARRRARSRGDGRRRGGRRRRRPTSRSATGSSSRSTSPAGTAGCAAAGCSPSARRPRCARRARARRCSATPRCTARCPAARPSTCACRRPSSARSRSRTARPDEQFLFLSDILPTAWQAVRYADVPDGRHASPCSASARSASSRARIAKHLGAGRVIGVDSVPERLRAGRALRRRDARPDQRRRRRRRR